MVSSSRDVCIFDPLKESIVPLGTISENAVYSKNKELSLYESTLAHAISITLPYVDREGNTIRLWQLNNDFVGSVQFRDGQTQIIPGSSICNPLSVESNKAFLHRISAGSLKRWSFVYQPAKKSITVWPHMVAAGKDGQDDGVTQPPKFSDNGSINGHIFRNQDGHFKNDTEANRQRILEATCDPRNYQGKDRKGNDIYLKPNKDGTQTWAAVRNGIITNAGTNAKPSKLLPSTGELTKWRHRVTTLPDHQKGPAKDIDDAAQKRLQNKDEKPPENDPRGGGKPPRPTGKGGGGHQFSPTGSRMGVRTTLPSPTPATKQFDEMLGKTGLEKSYRATHPNRPAPSNGAQSGEIGGVGGRVGVIEGLFDTPQALFERAHSFFIPAPASGELAFTDQELYQILHELAIGIYVHDALPFYSLHFNSDAHLYSVIHHAYEKTLVGQVFSMLDYDMKGYLNGGVFKEAYLKMWEELSGKIEAKTSDADFLNFHTYAKEHLSGDDQAYCSVQTLLRADSKEAPDLPGGPERLKKDVLQLLADTFSPDPHDKPIFRDYTKFTNSFRIIAKQKKIEKADDLFVLTPDFDVEYTIMPDPDYKAALEAYHKQYGKYPQSYEVLVKVYDTMKARIHDHMVKMPFCSKYFSMLGVINFFSYYFTTLKKHLKVPLLPNVALSPAKAPVLFPSLPILDERSVLLKFSQYKIANKIFTDSKPLVLRHLRQPEDQGTIAELETVIVAAIQQEISSHASSVELRQFNTDKDKCLKECKNIHDGLDLLGSLKAHLKQYGSILDLWEAKPMHERSEDWLSGGINSFLNKMKDAHQKKVESGAPLTH
ncbi:MAG: hypothetical protein JSR46_06885, partial [Verrucomicrobia bacterium]|nr:hypothetical protein [Verrucomicrobiota bacterium]